MIMYTLKKHLKLSNAIIEAKLCSKHLYVIDTENILYIFDASYNLESKKRVLKKSNKLHTYSNHYSIVNGNIAVSNETTLLKIAYKNRKIISKYKTEVAHKKIIFTSFCENAEYLLSAQDDGEVCLFDTLMQTTRFVFKNRADHCSYALFSQQRSFVYVGYFSGENVLLSLRDDSTKEFKSAHPIEMAQFFSNEERIWLCDRNGNTLIYDTITLELVSQKQLFDEWVSAAVLSPNQNYIIVGTRGKKLYIVDLLTNSVIKSIEHKEEGVTSMSLSGSTLQLSFANGSLHLVDLEQFKNEFLLHLELKEYTKAQEILEQNSFLFCDDMIEKFYAGFREILPKVKILLKKGQQQKALALVEPFMGIESFKEQIDALFIVQEKITAFVAFVKERDLYNAYEMARKYPVIQELHLFYNLEKEWENDFAKAIKILQEEQTDSKEKAKELLQKYENIVQKSYVIEKLFVHFKEFETAESLVAQHDFVAYFKFIEFYPFLKNTKLYRKVEKLASSLYAKALYAYKTQDYVLAQKSFSYLLTFPYYASKAEAHLHNISLIKELYSSSKHNEIEKFYTLVATEEFLSFTDIFREFNKKFEKSMRAATLYARTDRISMAQKLLDPYKEVEPLQKRINNLLNPLSKSS